MNLSTYVIVLFCFFILWKILQKFYFKNTIENPFKIDSRSTLKPQVFDHKQRDAVLKQNFKLEKVPNELDAIVIGSGIGGLSVAAILAKAGKKVLILEQHDQAGGCCHAYNEKGYEFDVGIHYIGEMHHQSLSRTYLDQISDGQLQWEYLSKDFDTVVFNEKNDKPIRYFSILAGKEDQKKKLLEYFPDEKEAIEKYYELVYEAAKEYKNSMVLKFLPIWLMKILVHLKLIHRFTKFFQMNDKTVKETVNELTTNQTLKDIFCYCFGDYGTVPSEAGFPMQALLMHHFINGAWYPVGGSSEIAHSIIPVIEKSGGKVLVRADVTEILVDSNKTVKGVKVKHGTQEAEIFAPVVISSAGFYNTFLKFIPQDIAKQSALYPLVNKKRGMGCMSIFIGLDSSAEELEIPQKKNWWIFNRTDIDQACVDYLKHPKEAIEDTDVPLMFVSFPSTKDPLWEKRYPGKTTMSIVTFCNYEWYEEWEKAPCQRRGDEYESLKKTVAWRLIDQVCDVFPQIKNNVDYVNIGTPLSNNFYLGAMKGEIYGLDHDKSRFSPLTYALLRPTTDIPGLFLSGQDVCSCGFSGALWGGLMCAQQVLGRNILKDLTQLHKKIKLKNVSKED